MQVQTFTDFVGGIPIFSTENERVDYLIVRSEAYSRLYHVPYKNLIRRLFGLNKIRNALNITVEEYMNLTVSQRRTLEYMLETVSIPIFEKSIAFEDLRGRTLDFGFGCGVSSILLYKQSKDVTAVDINSAAVDELTRRGMFPASQAYCSDGIEFMAGQPDASYNFICAIGFGTWDTRQRLVDSFRDQSLRLVRQGGKIMVASDLLTMDKVRAAFGILTPPYEQEMMVYSA